MSVMIGVMQDRLAEAGVVILAGAGQQRRIREMRLDQAFALERGPGGLIEQARRIARRHDGVAEMKMIAMRRRHVRDEHALALLFRVVGQTRKRLQER